MQRIRTLLAILSALLACASTTVPRALALAPGDVIDATKASSVADKVSPGILWCIQNGMNLTVGAYKQIVPPKGYVAATEQYAKQAHLSENGVPVKQPARA